MIRGIMQQFQAAGQALIELFVAELEAVQADLGRSGRQLMVGVGMLAVAAMFAFWFLGVLTMAGVEGLATILPRWAAALVVGLALLLVALIVGAIGWRKLKTLEGPARTVRIRLDDHTRWWKTRMLADGGEGAGQPSGDRE